MEARSTDQQRPEALRTLAQDGFAILKAGPDAQRLPRIYSYSDRIRYYWADPTVNAAVARLLDNLSACTLPENMLSQFLPAQYQAVRAGRLAPSPHALVLDRVREAIRPYAAACGGVV